MMIIEVENGIIYEIKHLFQPLANSLKIEYVILKFGLDLAHNFHALFLIIPILCMVEYIIFTVFNGSWRNTLLRIGIVVTIIALGQYLALHYLGYSIIDPFDPYVNNIDITLLRLVFATILDIAIFLVLYFEYVKDLRIRISSKRIPIYLLAMTFIALGVNAPLLAELATYVIGILMLFGLVILLLVIFFLPVAVYATVLALGALIIILGLFALPYLALTQLICMTIYAVIDAGYSIRKYMENKRKLKIKIETRSIS